MPDSRQPPGKPILLIYKRNIRRRYCKGGTAPCVGKEDSISFEIDIRRIFDNIQDVYRNTVLTNWQ